MIELIITEKSQKCFEFFWIYAMNYVCFINVIFRLTCSNYTLKINKLIKSSQTGKIF